VWNLICSTLIEGPIDHVHVSEQCILDVHSTFIPTAFVLRRGKNGRAVFRRKTLRSRLHQYRLSYQLVGVPTNGLAGGHGEGAAALAG
jgi:hypothetical protein